MPRAGSWCVNHTQLQDPRRSFRWALPQLSGPAPSVWLCVRVIFVNLLVFCLPK